MNDDSNMLLRPDLQRMRRGENFDAVWQFRFWMAFRLVESRIM